MLRFSCSHAEACAVAKAIAHRRRRRVISTPESRGMSDKKPSNNSFKKREITEKVSCFPFTGTNIYNEVRYIPEKHLAALKSSNYWIRYFHYLGFNGF